MAIHVFLSAAVLLELAGRGPADPTLRPGPARPAPWDSIAAAPMRGGLSIFWNVGGNGRRAISPALARGFKSVDILNTYSDYPGHQSEEIADSLIVPTNPWKKPRFFERIIRRNIASVGGRDLFVHDIELRYEPDPEKAWRDPAARAASGARTRAAFRAAYFREWASWFTLPCRWAKEMHPGEPVGIYGPQPFDRDYWGFVGKTPAQTREAHRADAALWKYIDPYVDFYVASLYCFYDDPGSIYAMAANLEENHRRAAAYGHKPIYAYLSLRYQGTEPGLRGKELASYLVEAAAVLPFFTGARGTVLWGHEDEPEAEAQPYQQLPLYMRSLRRVAGLSAGIGKAVPEPGVPAQILWSQRRPLVRSLKLGRDEWLVLAVDPWQGDAARGRIVVRCGGRQVLLTLQGRHTDLFHVRGGRVERLTCGSQ